MPNNLRSGAIYDAISAANEERVFEHFLGSRYVVNEEGCWIFTGAVKPNGYGNMGFHGKTRMVHRVTYELTKGSIPDGLVIDHTCHSFSACEKQDTECLHRRCINPEHLEAVTQGENTRRGRRMDSWAKYVPNILCYRGHSKINGVCPTCMQFAQEKYRQKQRGGEPAQSYLKGKIRTECIVCSTEIWSFKSRIRDGRGKTCSKECQMKVFNNRKVANA